MNENVEQVVQFLPEEYQGMVTTAIIAAMGAIALYYTVIKPLIAISANAKGLIAEKLNTKTITDNLDASNGDLNDLINNTFSRADILMINAKITELKIKLPYAIDEEHKAMLQAEIDTLKASLV
jgi:hypothetical protein